MAYVELAESPLLPGRRNVSIYYRDFGHGRPLLVLHGGWGYEAYPFDAQIQQFSQKARFLIPDRSGYGRSGKIGRFAVDFHRRAAGEMIYFLDALKISCCALWGHSDGAVIALWMALENPARFSAIVLEALHYYRNKPHSRSFFESAAADPDSLGERVSNILSIAHGEDYWRSLISNASDAWLRLADEAPYPAADLYDGRLSSLTVPVMLIHGAKDPRTEPDEIKQFQNALPHATVHIIETAGHSPHSEKNSCDTANHFAAGFLLR